MRKIAEEELLAEIDRLADGDDPPSSTKMNEAGEYSAVTYENRFGSWRAALEEAGYERPTNQYSEAELLAALRQMADDRDRPPTSTEMKQEGPHTAKTYERRFGSWDAALDAAGLDTIERGYTEAELRAELRRLADVVEGTPTTLDVQEQGRISMDTYYRRFGSLAAALEAAGVGSESE